ASLVPYTTLFRSPFGRAPAAEGLASQGVQLGLERRLVGQVVALVVGDDGVAIAVGRHLEWVSPFGAPVDTHVEAGLVGPADEVGVPVLAQGHDDGLAVAELLEEITFLIVPGGECRLVPAVLKSR